MADREEETYSVMFSSLKHPVRRKILRILAEKPHSFTEVLQQINIESAHLSYHLENLGDLVKKTKEGGYGLSDFGRAAVSLMTRVEEPERLVTPTFLRTPSRLRTVRVFCAALIIVGALLFANGVLARSGVDYRMTRMQTSVDTDYWIFYPQGSHVSVDLPYNSTAFTGFFYEGPGLYGIQIDLQLSETFEVFPLEVRIYTVQPGLESVDSWNQSWYEFSRPMISYLPDSHERLSVTLFASGNSAEIVTQEDFDHVHPSPGKVIGEFRPTQASVLIRVASDVGERNVTLSGWRAFQIKWFYFPQPQDDGKNLFVLSGLSLIAPSAIFILTSKNLKSRKENP